MNKYIQFIRKVFCWFLPIPHYPHHHPYIRDGGWHWHQRTPHSGRPHRGSNAQLVTTRSWKLHRITCKIYKWTPQLCTRLDTKHAVNSQLEQIKSMFVYEIVVRPQLLPMIQTVKIRAKSWSGKFVII